MTKQREWYIYSSLGKDLPISTCIRLTISNWHSSQHLKCCPQFQQNRIWRHGRKTHERNLSPHSLHMAKYRWLSTATAWSLSAASQFENMFIIPFKRPLWTSLRILYMILHETKNLGIKIYSKYTITLTSAKWYTSHDLYKVYPSNTLNPRLND